MVALCQHPTAYDRKEVIPMQYGLIGEKLSHSFSPQIHSAFGRYDYELLELSPDEVDGFFALRAFRGINVTIPYKERALSLCDEVEAEALRIGAVNTVVNRNGRLFGYNTDYYGMGWVLDNAGIQLAGREVLILGTGGTAKTAHALAEDRGAAKIRLVSRNPVGDGMISYEQAEKESGTAVVINASPAGMYPKNGISNLNLDCFPQLEAVFDAIYNPLRTRLLLDAEDRGILFVNGRGLLSANGLGMLVAQARRGAELFTDEPLPDGEIHRVLGLLHREMANISLLGMPGCGKTALGRKLAERLGKTFIDLDEKIVEAAGKPIPAIFAEEGEDAFRALESAAAQRWGREHGLVLSTGGGIVKRRENIDYLRQNGPILFIDCPVELLQMSGDRPLAKDRSDLYRLEAERRALYKGAAQGCLSYHPDFAENLAALEKLAEELLDKE